MYIVQIASECAPVIKAGGLGDVVYGLSRELEIRGNNVEIILPMYDCMKYDQIWGLHEAYKGLNCTLVSRRNLLLMFTADGYMVGCAFLSIPILMIISSVAVITMAMMIFCVLLSLVKLL